MANTELEIVQWDGGDETCLNHVALQQYILLPSLPTPETEAEEI
jgi:hypothetical protein